MMYDCVGTIITADDVLSKRRPSRLSGNGQGRYNGLHYPLPGRNMRYLIGIDDTDNLESRGTGHRARMLGLGLQEVGLGRLIAITRHQLLVHPAIRYTSHNSSACLVMDAMNGSAAALADFCRAFLLAESAPGSDAGLCIAAWDAVDDLVQAFGARAKREIVTTAAAIDLGERAGFILEGLTGDGGGVIGALAGVGLRVAGDDGRFLWLPGLRETTGVHLAAALPGLTGIEVCQTSDGVEIPSSDTVDLGMWCRPILRSGRAVLLVAPLDAQPGAWRVAAKEAIKALSD